VAVGLIAGTILIHQQLRHMQTKQLGLNEERVVVVHARNALYRNYETFKQELLRQSSITGVTASSVALPTTQNLDVDLVPEGDTRTQWIGNGSPPTNRMGVDADFDEVLEIPLVTGRGLSAVSDSVDVIPALINETAAQAFGWEHPVGKTLPCCSQSPYRVVGVIQDFHYQTLRQEIQPLVLAGGAPRYVLARVQSGEVSTVLEAIRKEWKQVSDAPFEYSFLDQRFEQAYRAEQRMANTFLAFAGLAIVIACLGLLGLAAYAARRREKEIGIRKTLGATARDVVGLLSKEFLLLVGIACLIAVPVAYLGMRRWLEGFAYRVEIRPWLFVGASLLAAAIALLTISVQALRAARTDPVTALRDE